MRVAMSASSSVHPRGCGEHGCAKKLTYCAPGSSPRVRGTRGRIGPSGAVIRFIPAGAGNTKSPPIRCPGRAVHPRGCGEHYLTPLALLFMIGSSPRVRGTRDVPHHDVDGCRFIPAGAGNTEESGGYERTETVHPRGCGEHCRGDPIQCAQAGSSPRVRGTLMNIGLWGWTFRFIPAGAGNTVYLS